MATHSEGFRIAELRSAPADHPFEFWGMKLNHPLFPFLSPRFHKYGHVSFSLICYAHPLTPAPLPEGEGRVRTAYSRLSLGERWRVAPGEGVPLLFRCAVVRHRIYENALLR
jgi:hypothetical protein